MERWGFHIDECLVNWSVGLMGGFVCSNTPTGVSLSAAAINFIPELIGITPQGVHVACLSSLSVPATMKVMPETAAAVRPSGRETCNISVH